MTSCAIVVPVESCIANVSITELLMFLALQWVGSLDFANNEDANGNVSITKSESLLEQEQEIVSGVKSLLGDSKLDCLVCVAGGWAGGNAAAEGEKSMKLLYRVKFTCFPQSYTMVV